MSKPFFSVVIPCYNSEVYIEQTLESIYKQSFVDFEVVLVDDQSSDQSFQIAHQYFSNKNLRGLCIVRDCQKYPKGVSGCRNQGVDMANGEWICFLDSDDLFHPEKLARVYDMIEQYPEIKAFHHAVTEFDDSDGAVIQNVVLKDIVGAHNKLPNLLDFNNICTSSVTVHKQLLLELNKFHTALFGIEDYYCWLCLSKKTQWAYDDSLLTRYRVRSESLMGFKPLKHYITQNNNILKVVSHDPRFLKSEKLRLEKHLMYNVMSYYTNNSINKFGLGSTHIALLGLISKGYVKSYFKIASRVTRNNVLKVVFGKKEY